MYQKLTNIKDETVKEEMMMIRKQMKAHRIKHVDIADRLGISIENYYNAYYHKATFDTKNRRTILRTIDRIINDRQDGYEEVWVMVTYDAFELPIAIADSAYELADITGCNIKVIKSQASRYRRGLTKRSRFHKVKI